MPRGKLSARLEGWATVMVLPTLRDGASRPPQGEVVLGVAVRHERHSPAFAATLRRMKIAVGELQSLVEQVLVRRGVATTRAPLLAATIVAAERDGSRSHGLQRLAGYVSSLSSGWVDGAAEPAVHEAGPGLLKIDSRNGFAQVALAEA